MRRRKTASPAPAAPTPNTALVPLPPLGFVPRAHSQGAMSRRWDERSQAQDAESWGPGSSFSSSVQSLQPPSWPPPGLQFLTPWQTLQAALPFGLSLSLPVPLPLPHFYLGFRVLFSLPKALIYLAAELVPLNTEACVKLSTPHRQHSALQMMPKPWATVPACLVLTTEWSRSIHLGVSPPPPKIKQTPGRAPTSSASLASVFVLWLFFPNHPNKGPCRRHLVATTV